MAVPLPHIFLLFSHYTKFPFHSSWSPIFEFLAILVYRNGTTYRLWGMTLFHVMILTLRWTSNRSKSTTGQPLIKWKWQKVELVDVGGRMDSGIVSLILLLVCWVPIRPICFVLILAYCCPCVVYGMVRSTFTGKPDNCVQDAAIFYFSAICCLAPALGAINRYEMREKYNIIGLHQSETAGAKQYFDGKTSNELLGKKDGHGLISVCFPIRGNSLICRIWLLGIAVVSVLFARRRGKLMSWQTVAVSKLVIFEVRSSSSCVEEGIIVFFFLVVSQ